ncbi:MAG: PfkB family carbohydrate kinase [archaeon]|uniref:PfkB family carbohydrate kinase n=1 Tax=Methanobrevibacter gottschalkii DSM 11977 TaxID=1122229 RepID=A0A3N5B3F5_9EURY|nr:MULTISPECIES: PfkB family carbohydrate kinase [Methanobrevibacter]MCQ2969951.1 PfkB family carbohydrate kinase [archaeon]OEC95213.1 ribokinase [Methanobrevibacter sp. A27]RPF51827.1 pfkB family carbohydrate kinase [Methanobrevibacter gottschalkii DSM 11977]
MTLVIIGPVTQDLVVIGEKSTHKIGGATYFQSFVFEKFYNDYLAIVNCSDEKIANEFPSKDKVKVILKEFTHFFINNYPDVNNKDYREQLSNFVQIPIFKSDLEKILPKKIDGFVINPLNRHDFPIETIDYLKSFNVPIFISIQGFLRIPDVEVNGKYAIKLGTFDKLSDILEGVSSIFLDEGEANITGIDFDVDEVVITDGSNGSRIISDNHETKINAVKCENIADATGCGDTYMAAYISKRLNDYSIRSSGEFASDISSKKLTKFGHY